MIIPTITTPAIFQTYGSIRSSSAGVAYVRALEWGSSAIEQEA